MKKIYSIILVIILFPSIIFADDKFIAKMTVVDVESILEHSVAVAKIKKSINNVSDSIQSELSKKEKALKVIEADIIKQRGILNENDFNDKVAEFNKKVTAAQKEMQDKKTKLEQAYVQAMAEIHKATLNIVSKLSKKYDFNIVLPSTQVLFVKNNLNITLEVITNLNEQLKEVKINYDKSLE